MTQSQRSRYLKTGGVLAFLLLLVFLLSSRDSAGVRELVKGVECLCPDKSWNGDALMLTIYSRSVA